MVKNMQKSYPDEVKKGLYLFNNGNYYEAHEMFEAAWRKTQDPSREFFRALLHITGGFFRLQQDKPAAARKFFEHALKWLSLFPDFYFGFNITNLRKELHRIISGIENGETNLDMIRVNFQSFSE